MCLKRLLDICGAFLLLVVFSPLMTYIAFIVHHSSKGPIIYRQKRVGVNGKIFIIYKFRTMKDKSGKAGIDVTSNGDSRITRVGRFLRASRLDELPQLWNVIKGEMSLVGPRPYTPEIAKLVTSTASQNYVERTKMKPGITGLAVLQRNSKELKGIVEDLHYDVLYVRKWSFWMDTTILFKTPFVMLKRVGI